MALRLTLRVVLEENGILEDVLNAPLVASHPEISEYVRQKGIYVSGYRVSFGGTDDVNSLELTINARPRYDGPPARKTPEAQHGRSE